MKILHTHTLVGRVKRVKEEDSLNCEKLQKVTEIVQEQFGNRPTIIVGQEKLANELLAYPEFYAAGWFRSAVVDHDGRTQELVIVDHGSTMEEARKSMLRNIKTEWNFGSKDV